MSFGFCLARESFLLQAALFRKKLEPVARLKLRMVASSSSWFVELFVLHFGSRLGATHRPLLGELQVEASSSSSCFVELFVLHFCSRLGATHQPLLGVGSSEKRRIDGKDRCLISPARVEKRGRIRGSSGRIAAHSAWIQLALAGARVRTT